MWLLVGLGNPGSEYARQRHNFGFMVVDMLADQARAAPWKSKFQGLLTECTIDNERVLLLKPQTYMNLSGQSVAEVARFYKIPIEKIIVFHDELDLPLGKIRIKCGGGHGGHNGLRSLDTCMGQNYKRVRLGIDHPGHKDLVHHYVLHDFAKSEIEILHPLLEIIVQNLGLILHNKDSLFLNKVTERFHPPRVNSKQADHK